ncbi:hypothetical protein CAPTEDRAFT_223772 [Capitella teleta]|uniref:CARD domain-containing protein n=1 Tax=Capitella teleta TaxID=283909 RepID=R7URU1_CAPTE|nr:hypothetical protein CAPTEDRAFT_223772 [Capitella teleta]|eukprot:ELU09239.1 hypothetical protein CAPTEDRAFT_223772 [Capitella teleta]
MSSYKKLDEDEYDVCDEGDREWEKLLPYYHMLSQSLELPIFRSWLISKNVLTPPDFEELEKKFYRSTEKIQHMMDMARRRGQRGYKAFVEVIEYGYPDLYRRILKKEPKDPPEDFRERRRKSTTQPKQSNHAAELLQLMIKCAQSQQMQLTPDSGGKHSENFNKMTAAANRLERENTLLNQEAQRLEDKLTIFEETIGELTDQRNEFQDGMDEAIKKRNELKVENSDLKNELRDNEIKLLENQQKINELKDQVAKNEFKHHSQFETLRRRNSELSLLLKSSENTQSNREQAAANKITELNAKLTEAERTSEQYACDANNLRAEIALLKESIQKLHSRLQDREHDLKTALDEAERKENSWRDELKKRMEMEMQSRTHSVRLKRTEQNVEMLRGQLLNLQLLLREKGDATERRSRPEGSCENTSVKRVSPPSPSDRRAVVFPDFVDVTQENPAYGLLNAIDEHVSSQVEEANAEELLEPTAQSVDTRPKRNLSRQDAMTIASRISTPPDSDRRVVIIFAPDDIRDDLFSSLSQFVGGKFKVCPLEEKTMTKSDVANGVCTLNIIHYEEIEANSRYRCLMRSSLDRTIMGLPYNTFLLLNVSPEAALALHHCNVYPLVIHVMFGAMRDSKIPEKAPRHLNPVPFRILSFDDKAEKLRNKLIGKISTQIAEHLEHLNQRQAP